MFSLSTVMDAIATAITTANPSYLVSPYPIGSPKVPQVIIDYPTLPLTYDYTFHAGGTTGKLHATIPVRFLVGYVLDKQSRDAISLLITDTVSLKNAIDGNLGGSVDYATVVDATVETINFGSGQDLQSYLGVRFDVEVVG